MLNLYPMPQSVIDLKSKKYSEPPRMTPQPSNTQQEVKPTTPEKENAPLAEWSSYDYQERERGPYWFLFPGGIATLLVIIGILAQSYFFIAFVILAFLVFLMYARRPPRLFNFSINKDGVRVGNINYPFSNLKSFWIFDRPDLKELSLQTDKFLMPFLRIPLAGQNPEKIRAILKDFLPEQEHQEFISDKIADKL